MKLTIKHEGQTINGCLPDSWEDITVKQFVDLNNNLTELELLSSLSGINLSFIENTDIDLTDYISYLNKMFSKVPPDIKRSKRRPIFWNGKTIKPPKNINFTRFGQKSMVRNIIESEKPLESMIGEVFAIYIQPLIDGKFDSKRIEQITEQVLKMPIIFVFPWVIFFFHKLKILKNGSAPNLVKFLKQLHKI